VLEHIFLFRKTFRILFNFEKQLFKKCFLLRILPLAQFLHFFPKYEIFFYKIILLIKFGQCAVIVAHFGFI
jgi:hypothetical protein